MSKLLGCSVVLCVAGAAALLLPTDALGAAGARSSLPACRDTSGPTATDSGPAAGAGARNLTAVGPTLFFAGCDRERGWELWRSDGREARTRRVADIRRGRRSSSPDHLVDGGGTLFFSANDGSHGTELWRSDGTRLGTRMVADIAAGARGSAPRPLHYSATQGKLFFSADDGLHGSELWETDGTQEGTRLVADIQSGAAGSSPASVVTVDGSLFFVASGEAGRQIYARSGESLRQVTDFRPALPERGAPRDLIVFGEAVYFVADDGGGGPSLWRLDPVDLRVEHLDFVPRTPRDLVASPTLLYFIAPSAEGRGIGDLWRTDGSVAGTLQLSQVSDEEFLVGGTALDSDGTVFFYGTSPDDFSQGVWMSDGTAEGTVQVSDLGLGTCRQVPDEIVVAGGRLFFVGQDGLRGELWGSDGTEGGTHLTRDIRVGAAPSKPRDMVAFGDLLAFTASDGVHGRELWVSDGSRAGTRMVKDIFERRTRSTTRLPFARDSVSGNNRAPRVPVRR